MHFQKMAGVYIFIYIYIPVDYNELTVGPVQLPMIIEALETTGEWDDVCVCVCVCMMCVTAGHTIRAEMSYMGFH